MPRLAPGDLLAPSGALVPSSGVAATTWPALFPSTTTYPGTAVYPGQGNLPIARCRLAFDDASVASPTWVEVANAGFRSFSVSRGRSSELTAFDAGTATVVLDNRNRTYDPTYTGSPYYPNVRPLNRVWIYEEFSGETHDLFKGYAESWDQQWPSGGFSDAVVAVNCADEFKVLALGALPTTNPPRQNYGELVSVDNPDGYWSMSDDPATLLQPPVVPIEDPDPPAPPTPGPFTLGTIRHRRHRHRW